MVKFIRLLLVSLLLVGFIADQASAQYSGSALRQATAMDGEASDNATTVQAPAVDAVTELLRGGPEQFTSPKKLSGSLQIMLLLTILSLAPAILLMTTSFVRIVVVLGLLRQALGTQQLPPSQVMTALALFMSLLVMTPTWNEVYQQAVKPYSEGRITNPEDAFNAGVMPIKRFMSRQIELAGNSDDVWLFYDYLPAEQRRSQPPQSYDEVPLQAILPAFMLSELKIAFLIGFQIYLPFLILDMVVSSVTISMGMMMLPPVIISLPLKLLLFVLVDGWTLIVSMLLSSFGTG
ncbi:Flagellar biosynthetic protein FliP precursor [Anatilimnocola aggregata]|uniref:Flagellar biosynthetic protein FliP n=1 Tax=Anatilimnocola aggregata TaxID=2528021 RepID=A0A517YFZ3_9BACT|nr:flagellar type III secretion system pore protein FliP [Anatilimnocola aggregata]QDU29150.1 Flagellar biosynthetic protein FliP precursor [Anatilimnocola aggregata]